MIATVLIPEMLIPEMTAAQLVVSMSAAAVIVGVLGESAWLVWTSGRTRVTRLPTVAAMACGALVAGSVVANVDAYAWPVVRGVVPDALTGYWDRHGALELVAAFVVWDAAGFVYHWVGHRTRVGWASHRVHHTGTEYDMTLVWRQSWIPLPALVLGPGVALVGFDLDAIVIAAAVSKVWQALVHTSLPVRTPRWVAATCMTPGTHRRHHCIDGGGVNLGSVLTVWDRLAGTWSPAPVGATADYGIAGSADRDGVVRLQIAGWRELALSLRSPRSACAAMLRRDVARSGVQVWRFVRSRERPSGVVRRRSVRRTRRATNPSPP